MMDLKGQEQIEQLEWVNQELTQFQKTYFDTLKAAPHLKIIIVEFEDLMLHLYTLIRFTILLAQQDSLRGETCSFSGRQEALFVVSDCASKQICGSVA